MGDPPGGGGSRPGMYRVWIDGFPLIAFVVLAGIGFWAVIGGLAWLVSCVVS